jgi:hypothetical protein
MIARVCALARMPAGALADTLLKIFTMLTRARLACRARMRPHHRRMLKILTMRDSSDARRSNG